MAFRNICIVGPGAIGGMMAVMLARAGFTVSTLGRAGKTEAIKARGLTLLLGGETFQARPNATASVDDLGPRDLIVVTLKSNALPSAARQLKALSNSPKFNPATPMVFAMNGVPWWFFDDFGGPLAGTRLKSLDPDGALQAGVPEAAIVWGVINCSVHELPDGSLRHTNAQHLILGRPNDDPAGLDDIAEVFRAANYKTLVSSNIRQDLWIKLLVNVTVNPVSALTLATIKDMLAEPLVAEAIHAVAAEMRALGLALGLDAGPDRFDRMKDAVVKTSMLQDLERGRPLELESIVDAVVEIAERCAVPLPQTRQLAGLLRLRARTAGLL